MVGRNHHLDDHFIIRDHPKTVVMLVPKRDLNRTISSVYGRDKAKQIQRSLNPQCLSGFGKDRHYRIRHAEVILPVDASDFTFYDCAYEELLQALGPINDDSSVPWTMFNDDVQMGFFDVYDQYLLNILYDPRIRPGMTKEGIGKLLPEVLPTVREWIANTNAVRGAKPPTAQTPSEAHSATAGGSAGESGYSGIAAALVAHRLRGLLAEYSEVPLGRRARHTDHDHIRA